MHHSRPRIVHTFAFLIASFSFGLCWNVGAQVRDPVPFNGAYRDGYVFTPWESALSDAQIRAMLRRLKRAGARQISVPIYGCQTSASSSDVGACEVMPRAQLLRRARLALQEGLKASFLPILVTPEWGWRGEFLPANPREWFANYTRWIVALAAEAQSMGMTEFVVGTEFRKLNAFESEWREVVRAVRAVFRGALVITLNWDEPPRGFWDEVDAIGYSAYFPLSASLDPTQAELDLAWRKKKAELLALSAQWKRPIHLTEVGYPNLDTAAREPWQARNPAAHLSPELQSRCFEAFTKAWKSERALVRMNVWAHYGADPNPDSIPTADPLDRPAERILAKFFDSRALLRWRLPIGR